MNAYCQWCRIELSLDYIQENAHESYTDPGRYYHLCDNCELDFQRDSKRLLT